MLADDLPASLPSDPKPMGDLVFCTASTDEELEQILSLQHRNVEENLSSEEVASQGFVTVHHDLELLRDMNRAEPQVIATSDGQVVGYALVMLRAFEDRVPILKPMCDMLSGLTYDGRPVDETHYFIMGQVCVDKPVRGKGVFGGMYRKMQELYSRRYDMVITEVARRNTRSIRAHEKVGFELLHRYLDSDGEEWDVILWDWSVTNAVTP